MTETAGNETGSEGAGGYRPAGEGARDDRPAGAGIGGRAFLRLILIGALIGIPAALLAAGFLTLVHQLQELLWEDLPNELGRSTPPWYLVVGLPVVGALIVVAARRLLPGDGGHRPIDGLSSAPTPASYGPGVALAALGSLPFGAVLGPEAPLIALGSVLGMAVAPRFELDAQQMTVLATAGSFAAIAALFGGPIVAGVLLLEAGVGMGAALIPALLPGLVSAAIGYLIFVGLGNWGGLEQTILTVPGLPVYEGTHLLDLLVGLVAGVVIALLLAGVRLVAARVAALAGGRLSVERALVGGALAIGLVALIAEGLGAQSKDVLFSGQETVPEIVAEGSVGVILVIVIGKAIGYAISLGCGFRGGPVFPAILLGVGVASVAVALFDVSPTLAVAVGTAAGMAAMTRLLFASLFFAMLLVGTHGLDAAPAAVLAAAAAWVTTAGLERSAQARAAPRSAT
ncbi:MAG: chloride channel protein [Solirubrobacterales bacterium]|nr:chloride channel protein [Solirubrobacterales bacterium]